MLLLAGEGRVGDYGGIQLSREQPPDLPGDSNVCRAHMGQLHPLVTGCNQQRTEKKDGSITGVSHSNMIYVCVRTQWKNEIEANQCMTLTNIA